MGEESGGVREDGVGLRSCRSPETVFLRQD